MKYRALDGRTTASQEVKRSLNILFQEPYFSRLWVIQELLLAKEIELVSGEHSAILEAACFSSKYSVFHTAPWYIRDRSWYGFTGHDLLRILLKGSQYNCADPRDKVFAVLGLIYQNDVRPAYDIPTECVYTGITAYIVSCCRNMDVLALAGTRYKSLNVPSWVPDWSQRLSLSFPSDFLNPESFPRTNDDPIRGSLLIIFAAMLKFDNKIQISRNTGCMHLRAIKLCDITGWISRSHDCTNVVMPKGEQGNLIITIPGITYQIVSDHLYLLSGWDHPVILRREDKSGVCSLISVCALSFGPPSSRRWFRPWHSSSHVSKDGVIRILPFSKGDDDMILRLHSNSMDLCRLSADSEVYRNEVVPPLSTVRNHIMNFSLLVATPLPDLEARLRDKWTILSHRLRWLFSDKAAVRTLMNDIDDGMFGHHRGESRIELKPYEDMLFIKFCGVEFPLVQSWDLRQFCWSFLTAAESDSTLVGDTPSPVLEELRSHIDEVKSWSEVTGQLFGVFEFTGIAFQHASVQFPGINLQQKWYRNYERFCEVNAQPQAPREQGQQNRDILFDTTCFWDWSEFETHLRVREIVWGQKLPAGLNSATNTTMAAHMGLNALGLSLYHEEPVNII